MVPAYYEQLDSIPMMASGKADRKRLPPPSERISLAATGTYTAPETPAETAVAEQLAAVLGLERVSADAHFFSDLGANSLLMAHFCARVRQHTDLLPPSIQDIYQHPTVRELAPRLSATEGEHGTVPDTTPDPVSEKDGPLPGTFQYMLCGAIQLVIFLAYTTFVSWLLALGTVWTSGGRDLADTWLRCAGFGAVMFVGLSVSPIVVKWILVGRWKPRQIRIWSLDYVRFWTVKTLTRANPLVLFAGSPLYVLYLRLLGAKIGKGVVIFSRTVPACPDLLTVGEYSVIHKNSYFLCFRARPGIIETGTVTLGRNVLVSESTVMDIGSSIGDDGQLGHASSLQTSQAVPAGEVWHGSPAVRSNANYRRVPAASCTTRRRVVYSLYQLVTRIVVVLPIGILGLSGFLPSYLHVSDLRLTDPAMILDTMAASLVLFMGTVIAGLLFVTSVPRLLNLFLKPDRVYPLYGVHFSIQRMIARITNIPLYLNLFGDSSYIVHYLRALGYDLCKVEQTGSNFGPALGHESPFLSTVGTGTMVSDGLNMMNLDFTNTSFRLSRVRVGGRNFLGNDISIPIGARIGENCLLATKVMVPIDGPVRTDVGLLGSPAFEIPRTVERDARFDELKTDEAKKRLIPAKNRHNIITMLLLLTVNWFTFFAATIYGAIAVSGQGVLGMLATSLSMIGFLLFRILFSGLVEGLVLGFRRLKPQYCSIYDPYFWHHERLWKLMTAAPFNGTPFKPLVWRMLGVRVGKRLYDPGLALPEKTLVTIGDDCAFNEGSIIQGHSMEDGTFKSGYTVVGSRCWLGVGAFVHYGVTMQDASMVAADSFLMKGTDVPAGAVFVGNPARDMTPLRRLETPPFSGPRHRHRRSHAGTHRHRKTQTH
jgi:non-ribosomal peptide synthetase-like protein